MARFILGTNLDDVLIGSRGSDIIRGKKGNDFIDGGLGKDFLYGEDGDDTLLAGYDDGTGDLFDGGIGIDTYMILGSAVENLEFRINLANGRDQYDNTYVSIENIIGGKAADVLIGNDDANILDGGAGDDVLRGGNGDDTLLGNAGMDDLVGGAGADHLDGGAGIDDQAFYSDSSAGVDVNLLTGLGTGGDAEGDTLVDIEHLLGSGFDDVLTGDASNNRLNGRAGNDELYGGEGNDTLIGGAGSDIIDGGAGNDTASFEFAGSGVSLNLTTGGFGGRAGGDTYISIENVTGSDFGDVITGNDEVNRLNGGDGNDQLRGAGGNDQLIGGLGSDALNGGSGIDTANYGAAASAVVVDLSLGGSGGEALGDSYTNIEFVLGSAFDDFITGDNLNNRLYGADGNDELIGGGGKDTLIGGAGNDTLTGDGGYDVFWFRGLDEGDDTITDFNAGSGMTDRIWLGANTGVSSWSDVLSASTDTAQGVLITLDNGTLLLNNLTVADLYQDDFII